MRALRRNAVQVLPMTAVIAPTMSVAPAAKPITSYRPFWAKRFGIAPFLPSTRAEMDQLLALADKGIAELVGLQQQSLLK